MNKLKKLQSDYRAGKLTKAQYEAAVKELLDGEDINQEEHDDALEFDPEEGGNEKPIYTQSEMDAAIVKKARALVKKAAREAGLELQDVAPRDLINHIAGLAATGSGKQQEGDKEVAELRRKASLYDQLEPQNKSLVVENAVLKAAGKYNPVNPSQVVRALNADYSGLLEFDDETGSLDSKSVSKAIKRIAEAEPNLFKDPQGGNEGEGGQGGNEGGQGSGFSGKTPGGAGAGSGDMQAEKLAADKARALELMGLKKPE
ncbi:hypothetical protein ACF5W4_11150 [Bacillota bacterium Lsc_1132]